MKLAIQIASASLALSLLVMVGLNAASLIGYEFGWSWSPGDESLAAALGFGAMWLASVSGAALLVLAAAWVVSDALRRNGDGA